ncbi:MAG: GNAT family N-acetyltransferase [Candidatus Rokubacteria bacterium]|nr:GNAT family N-acetyltransferase [Candidatus Rokubacteria bacterium]
MLEIRHGGPDDIGSCLSLAAELIDSRRGQGLIQAALDRRQLLVARDDGRVVGFLTYRTDWFNCTFVSVAVVTPDRRREGIARALFRAVEERSPGPRLFSSTDETNAASIRMHSALGFTASGYIDNLPQGYRELLFYKRLPGRIEHGHDGVSILGDSDGATHA